MASASDSDLEQFFGSDRASVIVSIAEQNDRLAAPDRLQHVARDVHERVVKHRAGESCRPSPA